MFLDVLETSCLAYSNVPSNQRTMVLANGNASRPDVSFVSPFWNGLAPVYAIIYGTIWYLISRKVRYPLIRRCQKQQFPGARGRQCPRFGNRSAPLGSIASRRGVPVPRGDLMAIAIWVEDG